MTNWFDRIFHKQNELILTDDLSSDTRQALVIQSTNQKRQIRRKLSFATSQSCGKIREHNEDTLFANLIDIKSGESTYAGGLFLVADGMGGHENGELASKLAAETFFSAFLNSYQPGFIKGVELPSEIVEDGLLKATMEAHERVAVLLPGSGTTFTAAWVNGGSLTLVHVGDSRAYIINRNGQIQLLTKDHSLVQRLVDLGQISEKRAALDPRRNILYRALGQLEPLEPDVSTMEFPENSVLLICSDGLWGVVNEERIRRIITSTDDLEDAVMKLVEAANHAGGPDNISAILVEWK
jgi:PPM family protein phosphatase